MRVAVHPTEPSPALLAAFEQAGIAATPVMDAAAVLELEPDDGWGAVVVEIGADAAAALGVARRIKDSGTAPVLVVSGRGAVADIASATFDDFLLTPIDPAELAVRVARLGDSTGDAPEESISFKHLTLNLATYQADLGGDPIDLTFMEYELLRFFVGHQVRVWSREQLLSRVWGYDYFGGARTVDVHVRRLRAKLGEERASWITTVRSVGYRFG